jgi:pimeloyl-ACP methyl ester carboxylesterase
MTTDLDHSILTRTVVANGYPINVKDVGEGDPLLVINGLTRSLDSWDNFTDAVGGHRVISFDAPGVGDSENSFLPLSIAQLATICVAIIDELGLERVDVLGFSLGGAVAQELAGTYPTRVRRLVLAATSCGIGSTLEGWDVRDGAAVVVNGLFYANALSTLWRVMAYSSWSSIPFLGSIDAATLVVCGTEDRVAPISNSRMLAGRIPNATLIELDAGHDLQESGAAEQLALVVRRFLATEPAPTEYFTL